MALRDELVKNVWTAVGLSNPHLGLCYVETKRIFAVSDLRRSAGPPQNSYGTYILY
jgi:hypothetical protein